MPWYSGDGGPVQLLRAAGDIAKDIQRVRRGWHWDTPRPRTWPEQGAVVPTPASDLGWARQEPVRTLRARFMDESRISARNLPAYCGSSSAAMRSR